MTANVQNDGHKISGKKILENNSKKNSLQTRKKTHKTAETKSAELLAVSTKSLLTICAQQYMTKTVFV